MFKLYFLIGISGSGKSTYIKSHFLPEVVVSPDELRKKYTGDISDQSQNGKIWGMVPGLLKKTMEQYGKAVLDSTMVDSDDREKTLKPFDRDKVERIAIVFDTDPEESKRRIHKDLEVGKDRSDVPDDAIDRQHEKFKRGYNTIKQQFDKVIDGNKGRSLMKKEDINKIRKIVKEEMKSFIEQDSAEQMEKAEYQAYQDMYLTPQSNWRVKQNVPMLDSKGREYSGKLGEIHKIQTVEYDLMHHGEVVTECGGETYSIESDDFRKAFEMVNDEEGLQTNNESVNSAFGKPDAFKIVEKKTREAKENNEQLVEWKVKIQTDGFFTQNTQEYVRSILLWDYEYLMRHLLHIMEAIDLKNLSNDLVEAKIKIFPSVKPFFINWIKSDSHVKKVYSIGPSESIKEEVKKLSKIKDYFGKNIRGSIEKLEEAFLKEDWDEPDDSYLEADYEDRVSGTQDDYDPTWYPVNTNDIRIGKMLKYYDAQEGEVEAKIIKIIDKNRVIVKYDNQEVAVEKEKNGNWSVEY